MSAYSTRLGYEELVAEFEWTWSRHQGDVCVAAPIFDCRPDALARRLNRARQRGFAVRFRDSSQVAREDTWPREV